MLHANNAAVDFHSPRVRDGSLTDDALVYAADARCLCGAGLAYIADCRRGTDEMAWHCSDVLTGRAPADLLGNARTHVDGYPFAFYEIKSETQPSAQGRTTRPASATTPAELDA